MGILLGGIDITGLVKDDYFGVPILTETQIADDGSIIVYNKELVYSDIILSGGSDWGWLTYGILEDIRSLASVIEGIYTLDYEGTISNVRFKTEDIPVIEATRLIDTPLISNENYYNNIIIKLMEV